MWLTPVKLCIQVVCPRTGKLLESRTINSTSLAYCLDEDDRRMLVVGEGKDCREFPVQGGVRVITRFATEGKATLQLIKRNTMLLISGADPDALQVWCRSLMSGGASRKAEMLAPQAQRQRQELEFAKRPLSSRSPGFANGLTEEQQAVLSAALSGRSLFFTGGAGTGKSFLLRQIMQRMPAATTFATASTGVAACQIGGTTIHFWAGVGAGDRSVAECASMASRRRGAQWAAARCLIIDEISMLDASFFEKLEAVARRVRNNQKPFGGLQLILSGDFFQLPPVSRDGFRFAFEAESWARCVPQLVELTTVFRQSDPAFVAALNEVRLGRCSDQTRLLLQGCLRRTLPDDDGVGAATRLCSHVKDCERINTACLAELPGEIKTFRARDTGRDDASLAQLRSSAAAPAELKLKAGAQVILTKTLDAANGLVNGARGRVLRFLATQNPVVRFGTVEHVIRMEQFSLSQGGQTIATRTQLPLSHGWALSIHKSQGMTLDRVQLSLGKVFECGQIYVALSRARSLEGLSLTDIDLSKLSAHPKALAFHEQCCNRGGGDSV